MKCTAVAPTNIAIIKYWGKEPEWEEYHIPTKSSLSFTVKELYTKTTVDVGEGSGGLEFHLNGETKEKGDPAYEYVLKFLEKLRNVVPEIGNYDYRIISKNNFPTAAGFASSASGFAALVKAIAGVMKEEKWFEEHSGEKELSVFARLGSGSAARSIPCKGGVVVWKRGEKNVSETSYAESVVSPEFLQEISIIYVKIHEGEKKIKSREGMKLSVETNPLYWEWVNYEEGKLLPETIGFFKGKNFKGMFENIMKASNNLHQICMGTYPPIIYLNEKSREVIERIHEFNEKEINAAYTFDAGPNAVVFTTKEHEKEVMKILEKIVGKGRLVLTAVGEGPRYVEEHLEV